VQTLKPPFQRAEQIFVLFLPSPYRPAPLLEEHVLQTI
jgi:hypothetical protein